MPEEERRPFEMTDVYVANQLYGDEVLRSLERKNGRFCNTGMKAALLGGIVSDGLEDGTVISGVGGRYNFVSMAHALKVLKTRAAGPQGAEFTEMMEKLPDEIPANLQPFMERMQLTAPCTPDEVQVQKTFLLALRLAGFC